MKIHYVTLKGWLLAGIAALFGLNTSCNTEMEYGCPIADFEMKGCVSDGDGHAIEGIAVCMDDNDMATTDANGCYDVRLSVFPLQHDTLEVSFTDVDGDASGHYADTTILVPFDQSELDGGDGGWYMGRVTKRVDVKMRKL